MYTPVIYIVHWVLDIMDTVWAYVWLDTFVLWYVDAVIWILVILDLINRIIYFFSRDELLIGNFIDICLHEHLSDYHAWNINTCYNLSRHVYQLRLDWHLLCTYLTLTLHLSDTCYTLRHIWRKHLRSSEAYSIWFV